LAKSKELHDLSAKAGNELQIHYVPLKELANHFLQGNSKRHDIGTLHASVDRHAFRDPIAFDVTLNGGKGGILEGNGRLELLCQLREGGFEPPKGITAKDGEWFVPCIFGVDSESEQDAIAYSISHNISPLWGADGLTFIDATKLFDDDLLKAQLTDLAEIDLLPIGISGDDLDLWMGLEDFVEAEGQGGKADPPDDKQYQNKYGVLIECVSPQDQEETYNSLTSSGYQCKILTV
jgi:hypothetical protein